MHIPRVVIAGLAGGTGKTTVSLGIIRALAQQGVCIQPFKKGPDYIDTRWLGCAAGRSPGNLDPFMLTSERLRGHFCERAHGADLAIIEGNRGMFDGRDLAGSCSTAEVAGILDAPVILVVDCTKMTRTVAAVVAGCKAFPGGERIHGVILNNVGNKRHRSLAQQSVEEFTGLPVLGCVPRFAVPPIIERKSGLLFTDMHGEVAGALDFLATVARDNLDLQKIQDICRTARNIPYERYESALTEVQGSVRIGLVRDAVLWQYYDENLEALRATGATLVDISLFSPESWPALEGVYLGGGDIAPHAGQLPLHGLHHLASLVAGGMPVYAEQSGFVCLMESVEVNGVVYPMAGVFPLRATVCERPQGLGYVEAVSEGAVSFAAEGERVRGHEYHYFRISEHDTVPWRLTRTVGVSHGRTQDGLALGNCWGSFMQIFAPALPGWAVSFVNSARIYKERSIP